MTTKNVLWVGVGSFTCVACCLLAWPAAKAADGHAKGFAAASPGPGEEAVDIKLPKPMFVSTPRNLKPSPTLEPFNGNPRPAFYAPKGTKNIALKKKVTSSDTEPIIGELAFVTDGDKEAGDGSFVELAPGKQWVQIDLGEAADIYAMLIWHYHAEPRVYHDVIVQVADDPKFAKDVKTLFNNDFDNSSGLGTGKNLEYIDDYRGKLIDAKDAQSRPIRGRYVRLYSKGNTSNDQNQYIEVEVYGK